MNGYCTKREIACSIRSNFIGSKFHTYEAPHLPTSAAMSSTMVAFAASTGLNLRGNKRTSVIKCCEASPVAAEPSSSASKRVADALANDLPRLFTDPSGLPSHYALFSSDVEFKDPVTSFTGVSKYRQNINFLRNSPVFTATTMQTHDIQPRNDTKVTTRWTMSMTVRLFPWRPVLYFTGESDYIVDAATGLVTKHIDRWDSLRDIDRNSSAISDISSQFAPKHPLNFQLLRRSNVVEYRMYSNIDRTVASLTDQSRNTIDMKSTTIGKVVAIAMKPGDSVERTIATLREEVEKDGNVVPDIPQDTPFYVAKYRKSSPWENLLLWKQPVQEVWIPVDDINVNVDP